MTFLWQASVRLDGKLEFGDKDEDGAAEESVESVLADLFTGTESTGVPGGLYLGRARLPLAKGKHQIELTDSTFGATPSTLFVRTTHKAAEAQQ